MSNTNQANQDVIVYQEPKQTVAEYLLEKGRIWSIGTVLFTALATFLPVHTVTSKSFPIHGEYWNQPAIDLLPLFAVQLLGVAAVLIASYFELVKRKAVYPEHYTLLTFSTFVLAMVFTAGLEHKLNDQPAPPHLLAAWVEYSGDECAVTRTKDAVARGAVITGNVILHIQDGCNLGRMQLEHNEAQKLALARY